MGNVPRGLALAALAAALVAGCGEGDRDTSGAPPAEPSAGDWKPWVLPSPSALRVPPPPAAGSDRARRDAAGLRAAVRRRTRSEAAAARRWNANPAVAPWIRRAMDFVSLRPKDPPSSSRAYALVSVAMEDAAVAAWHWKERYGREAPSERRLFAAPPDPSYPSEHAAIAGAASRVLAYLFPEQPEARLEQGAEEAARSRVVAGVAYPSDAAAGLALGRAVAARVIEGARHDGSTRKWDGRRPHGRAHWNPPPGSAARPVQPLAGKWETRLMSSGREFRPGPPPRFGSPRFRAEARELIRIRAHLTARQKRIATFWAGGEGTPLPAGIWNQVMLRYVSDLDLSTPRASRVFAYLNVAQADAGVAAWDAKYAYWSPRPENGIRDLGLDPRWKPYLDTPFFPSYISGHATYSGAAAEILGHLFPDDAGLFRAKAREAARSRALGGIHWRSDNVVGLRVGREVGRLAVRRAERDGAE